MKTNSYLIDVNDLNFDEVVLNSSIPVLIEFGSTWCGPCARQLPILEEYAAQNKDKIKVCKLDTDDAPNVTSKFGIRSVPTILLFNDGKKLDSKVGFTSLAILSNFVLEKIQI